MDKILEQKGFEEGKVYAIVGNRMAYAVEVKDGRLYKGKLDYTDYVTHDFNCGFVKFNLEIPITIEEYKYLRCMINRYHTTCTITDITRLPGQYGDILEVRAKKKDELYDVMWADYKISEVLLPHGSFAQLEANINYSTRSLGLKGFMECD